ncbi:helix-turn-helix domain-containing protein [Parapedobacter sp. DT-150]|uniref:helix-turn-helix domain-containing protein n=1 Tax=Parapedobacter sp. DT-150 TaxID=3396162 RepID=UPI003F1CDDA5
MKTFIHTLTDYLSEIITLLRQCVEMLHAIQREQAENPDPLHDAKYAANRIGVVDRTLYRLIKKGILPVDSYENGRRLFRESDIERCRRYYHGE